MKRQKNIKQEKNYIQGCCHLYFYQVLFVGLDMCMLLCVMHSLCVFCLVLLILRSCRCLGEIFSSQGCHPGTCTLPSLRLSMGYRELLFLFTLAVNIGGMNLSVSSIIAYQIYIFINLIEVPKLFFLFCPTKVIGNLLSLPAYLSNRFYIGFNRLSKRFCPTSLISSI